jgi:ribosomal protein L21E
VSRYAGTDVKSVDPSVKTGRLGYKYRGLNGSTVGSRGVSEDVGRGVFAMRQIEGTMIDSRKCTEVD